jgi:hypothetical protein
MEKARAVLDFVVWAISDEGQTFAEELSYVPLPDEVQELNLETLRGLTFNGQQVFGTEEPPSPEPVEFSVSGTHDGNSYTETGTSTSVEATAFSIAPRQFVTVELEGNGEIELTLPKSMIDGITRVMVGNEEVEYEEVSTSSSSTTSASWCQTAQIQWTSMAQQWSLNST